MKIVNISHYYVNPPLSGGQIRIYNLNRNLAKTYNCKIEQFSFTPALRKRTIIKNKNYNEHIIPVPFYILSAFFIYRILKVPFDFIIPSIFRFVKIPEKLRQEIESCDIIQVEHPWLFSWVYRYLKKNRIKKPVVLVEHNIECELQKVGLRKLSFFGRVISFFIKRTELYAVKKAAYIITTSDEDRKYLVKNFKINKAKIAVVPNGVDLKKFKPISRKIKEKLKKKFGFRNKKVVLFAASGHPPNHEAVKIIENDIAPKCRDFIFLVAGSVHEKGRKDNIVYTGKVDDILSYFQLSDIAINPVLSGSGTNIKMLEYMAAGLPIVTTEIGARGFNLKNKKDMLLSNINEFSKSINSLYNDNKLYTYLGFNGREISFKYSYILLANKNFNIYKNILNYK